MTHGITTVNITVVIQMHIKTDVNIFFEIYTYGKYGSLIKLSTR